MRYIIILLLLLLCGTAGLLHYLLYTRRRQALLNLLNAMGEIRQQTPQPIKSTPLEQVLLKTSRIVSLSATLDRNITAKVLTMLILIALLLGLNSMGLVTLSRDWLLIILLLIVTGVIILPSLIKRGAVRRRFGRIAGDLPYIIDMMAICVQSGMTIEKAIRYLADHTDNINPDIAGLLDRTMLRAEVSGINAALDQLYQEMPANEMRMLCTTLQQSLRYGSSIYQILIELSKDMREMQLLATEERVASLSARMTVPMILFIMFPLLVIIAGPSLLKMVSLWSK